MHNYLYLTIAIIAEVVATTALKASFSFTKLTPSIIAIVGYCCAFYSLSFALRTIPAGVAYAIWSGFGIILISLADYMLFGQKLSWTAYLGLVLIISGTAIVHVK